MPTRLQPDEKQRDGRQSSVYRVVGRHVALQPDVGPLEDLERTAGYDAGDESALQLDLGVGQHEIDEGEHQPYSDYGHEGEQYVGHPCSRNVRYAVAYVDDHAVGDDPQYRGDEYYRDVVCEFTRKGALLLDLPYAVEYLLHVAEHFDHRPQQEDETGRGDDASACLV